MYVLYSGSELEFLDEMSEVDLNEAINLNRIKGKNINTSRYLSYF